MNIENIPVRDIKPYEKNAKKHSAEQVEHIANSIKEFGFKQPLVVDADNVLVIGHGRLLAAKKLGMKEVPCVRADDLTPEQIKALRLADNKTNESDWEAELLNIELDDITDIDMGLFGFVLGENDIDEDEENITTNPTLVLPDSRIFVFSVSSFGTNSECFIEAKLSEEEAGRLQERLKEVEVSDVVAKLREALNAV